MINLRVNYKATKLKPTDLVLRVMPAGEIKEGDQVITYAGEVVSKLYGYDISTIDGVAPAHKIVINGTRRFDRNDRVPVVGYPEPVAVCNIKLDDWIILDGRPMTVVKLEAE